MYISRNRLNQQAMVHSSESESSEDDRREARPHGRPSSTSQVMLNLYSNLIVFSEEGGWDYRVYGQESGRLSCS